MRWASKLLLWRLRLCSSTTNRKNKSSLGLRMMENGLCKYGEIWLNMDKLYQKKGRMAMRMISQFFHIYIKTRLSKKTLLELSRQYRALPKWQTGPGMTHLLCNTFESENKIFRKRSKNMWNFQKKKFLLEKISGVKILKSSQTHVNR